MKQTLYTASEISQLFKIHKTTILKRCKELNLPLMRHQYLLTWNQAIEVANKVKVETIYKTEIIKVTETYHIYESKLNNETNI